MLGSKPCVVFQGGLDLDEQSSRIKNLLADFFRGRVIQSVNLGVPAHSFASAHLTLTAGLDHVIAFTLVDSSTILFRHYRPTLKKSDSRLPLVEVPNSHHP